MPTRLKPIALTVYKDRSGSDVAQVPASGITAKVYRRGASVSAAGPTTVASHTVIAVYDAGRLRVGDTVQKGTSAAATATVYEVTSPTSVKLDAATGTLSLSRGDRLLVTNSRPTLYDESTGGHSTGSSDVTTTARGFAQVYSTEPSVDVILTGTGITDTLLSDVAAGYEEPSPWIDVRDYGGAAVTDSIAAALAALPSSGGTVFLPPGTYTISAALQMTLAHTRLIGDAVGAVTIQSAASNPTHHMVEITNNRCVIGNIFFECRGTTAGNYDCIRMSGGAVNGVDVSHCHLHDLTIHAPRRNGLRITEIYECTFDQVMIFEAFGDGVFGQVSGGGTDPVSGGFGATDNTHLWFRQCRVHDSLERGFVFTHGYGIHFTRCTAEALNATTHGTATNEAVGFELHSCQQSSIEHCHNEGPNTGVTRSAQWIYLDTCNGATVIHNSLVCNSGDSAPSKKPTRAILIENSACFFIAANRVSDMNANAVVVAADCHEGVVCESFNNSQTTCYDLISATGVTYLGGRGVRLATFADNTARDASLTGAFTADGTLIYVTSPTGVTNKLQIRSGGAWVGVTGT